MLSSGLGDSILAFFGERATVVGFGCGPFGWEEAAVCRGFGEFPIGSGHE
jgi:hypothetical protein